LPQSVVSFAHAGEAASQELEERVARVRAVHEKVDSVRVAKEREAKIDVVLASDVKTETPHPKVKIAMSEVKAERENADVETTVVRVEDVEVLIADAFSDGLEEVAA